MFSDGEYKMCTRNSMFMVKEVIDKMEKIFKL